MMVTASISSWTRVAGCIGALHCLLAGPPMSQHERTNYRVTEARIGKYQDMVRFRHHHC